MQKCDFSKVANQLYWNHTPTWVSSCKCAAYLQNSCFGQHLWGTTSENVYSTYLSYFQYQFVSNLGYFLIYIWIVQCSDVQCWDIQVFYSISFVFQNSLFTFSDSFHVNCILSSFIYLSFFTRWCLIKLLSKCYLTCYVAFSFEKLFYKKNSFFYWYFRPCNIESLPEKIFLNTFINILSLSYLVMTLKLIFRLSIPELPH